MKNLTSLICLSLLSLSSFSQEIPSEDSHLWSILRRGMHTGDFNCKSFSDHSSIDWFGLKMKFLQRKGRNDYKSNVASCINIYVNKRKMLDRISRLEKKEIMTHQRAEHVRNMVTSTLEVSHNRCQDQLGNYSADNLKDHFFLGSEHPEESCNPGSCRIVPKEPVMHLKAI